MCECVGFEIGHQGVSTFCSVACDVCINLAITSNCKQKRRRQWWYTTSKKWCTTGSICFGLGHKYVLNGISCFFLIYLPSSMSPGVLSFPVRRVLGNGFIEGNHYLKWRKGKYSIFSSYFYTYNKRLLFKLCFYLNDKLLCLPLILTRRRIPANHSDMRNP